MLDIIARKIVLEDLPATFSGGVQDYVFVDDCANAHVDCMLAMSRVPHQSTLSIMFAYDMKGMSIAHSIVQLQARRSLSVASVLPCKSTVIRSFKAYLSSFPQQLFPSLLSTPLL